MLIGVEQIHDMHGIVEMGRAIITSPVGQHDHRVGLLQTPAQSLGVQAPAKERAGFNGPDIGGGVGFALRIALDRKSTRLNSSHSQISYAVFCLKKKKKKNKTHEDIIR